MANDRPNLTGLKSAGAPVISRPSKCDAMATIAAASAEMTPASASQGLMVQAKRNGRLMIALSCKLTSMRTKMLMLRIGRLEGCSAGRFYPIQAKGNFPLTACAEQRKLALKRPHASYVLGTMDTPDTSGRAAGFPGVGALKIRVWRLSDTCLPLRGPASKGDLRDFGFLSTIPGMSTLDPKRTVTELQELRALTTDGSTGGAMRVAWTDTWLRARDWLRETASGLPLEVHNDQAGNTWFTLRGKSEKELLIGGHMDSVPSGGWLDGCLNVLAGLEVLRRINDQYHGQPPVTVRLVDWADEEGARFGRSLLGSSACGGVNFVPDVERVRTDKDGIRLDDALRRCGVNIDEMRASHAEIKNAAAYLELHIEQGPVLESMDLPLGAVLGTFGVERHAIKFTGQAAHSGSTPMDKRRDALAAAAKLALEIRPIAHKYGGVCTMGSVVTKPGIVTAVVGECDATLDQRALSASKLARMYKAAQKASNVFAKEEKCAVSWSRIWNIEPILFNKDLIKMCYDSCVEVSGQPAHKLPSGPLHDAAEVSRAGVPTVMMFVQSLHGISHNPIEDTKIAHIEMSVRALDRLADKTIAWILK